MVSPPPVIRLSELEIRLLSSSIGDKIHNLIIDTAVDGTLSKTKVLELLPNHIPKLVTDNINDTIVKDLHVKQEDVKQYFYSKLPSGEIVHVIFGDNETVLLNTESSELIKEYSIQLAYFLVKRFTGGYNPRVNTTFNLKDVKEDYSQFVSKYTNKYTIMIIYILIALTVCLTVYNNISIRSLRHLKKSDNI